MTHSVYTKLVCCIDGILQLKEHISKLHVRQQHSVPEIEVIREVLFVLSNMLNNLEEESLFWNAKMERLSPNIQEQAQSSNFVHFDLNGLPGRPKITIDVEQIHCKIKSVTETPVEGVNHLCMIDTNMVSFSRWHM